MNRLTDAQKKGRRKRAEGKSYRGGYQRSELENGTKIPESEKEGYEEDSEKEIDKSSWKYTDEETVRGLIEKMLEDGEKLSVSNLVARLDEKQVKYYVFPRNQLLQEYREEN